MGGAQGEMRVNEAILMTYEDGLLPLNASDGGPDGGAASIWCHLHAGCIAGPFLVQAAPRTAPSAGGTFLGLTRPWGSAHAYKAVSVRNANSLRTLK